MESLFTYINLNANLVYLILILHQSLLPITHVETVRALSPLTGPRSQNVTEDGKDTHKQLISTDRGVLLLKITVLMGAVDVLVT